MKRSIAALFLAAFLLVPAAAQASGWPRWDWEEVSFRTSVANGFALGGQLDTAYACGSGARVDTTAAIELDGWAVPPSTGARTVGTTLAVDSVLFAVFQLYPSVNANASVDTFYINIQVSMDGENWLTTTPTGGAGIIGFNATGGSRAGAWILDNTAANCVGIHLKQAYATTGAPQIVISGATAPTWNQLFGWRWIRFLVGSTNTGCYKAQVAHYWVDK